MRQGLPTQEEIMATWKGDIAPPILSIFCTSYNHIDFIEDALEGFLIQKTDFPFVIVIHDDASTDGTADIIREYEKHYPLIIKPIYQKENQYSQGIKPLPYLYERCETPYIAVCEGDDYWTDPTKLAIQVRFLETHPEYIISGHDAYVIDEQGKKIDESKLLDAGKRDYEANDLMLARSRVLTLSWVIRHVPMNIPPEIHQVVNVDDFFVSLLGHYGKSKYHDDIKPAAYRRHQGGAWSGLPTRDKDITLSQTYLWMYRYYLRIGNYKCASHFWKEHLVKYEAGATK